jgi:putative ABC transport system permease protein
VSMLTALASGLLPAWFAGRTAPMVVLQGGRRTHRRALGVRGSVLVGQTAVVTLLALIGAASARTLWKARTASPGFDTRGLALARLDPLAAGYDVPKALDLARRLVDQLNVAPQSQTATISRLDPVNRATVSNRMALLDPVGGGATPLGQIAYDEVAPNYFELMGIPLLMGRAFSGNDSQGSPLVMIVNSSASRHWPWPNGEPVGSLVQLDGAGTYTVVGVVGDVTYRGVLSPPRPFVYVPLYQRTSQSVFDHFGFTIHLRSRGGLDPAVSRLRLAVRALDPALPVEAPRAITAVIMGMMPLEYMLGGLASVFAPLALLVCSVGFYATASQIAAEREREFGVRMAVGARPTDVVLLVLRWWLITIGTGLVIGLVLGTLLASAITRTQGVVLSMDGLAIGSVCMIVLTVSLVAICVPVWRALRTDPATTLRLPSETR